MAFRRRIIRFKKNLIAKIRYWLRHSVTLEKIVALLVIFCVLFILVCNYILQTPVKLKSPTFSEINIKAGTLRIPQDDPRLLNHIKRLFLILRPPRTVEKSFSKTSVENETRKITDYVLKLTNNQTGGFFVEYPAKDGLLNSQTKLLEKLYNWTGLLIEHDPKFITLLKQKGRYCWISTACLSTNKYPELEKHNHRVPNKTEDSLKFETKQEPSFFAQCFPLYSILLSVNVKSVDFLSLRLDDAATGLAILKTLPFGHSLSFKVIAIDVEANSKEYRKIFQFVTSQGYIMFRHIKRSSEAEKSILVFVNKFQFISPDLHT